jgi:RNA polymerase sigma factor FliA
LRKNTARVCIGVHDKEEYDRILLEQLPQVRCVARRIHKRLPKHIPFEDLVHSGVIGLIDALAKFDHAKHVQFGLYARFRIRGAILDGLREMDWGPRELRRRARLVEDAERNLSMDLSRTPTEVEVATKLKMELWKFQQLRRELNGLAIGSLHVESRFGAKEEDLSDCLSNPSEETPLFFCMRSEMKQLLARAVEDLGEKEKQVLGLYYFEEHTMKEIGTILGFGESRVSQIHSLAVVHLRSRLEALMRNGKPIACAAKAGGS